MKTRFKACYYVLPTLGLNMQALIEQINWNEQGLVAAIAQDIETNQVLMLAWMNDEALKLTLSKGQAVYFSRSRQKLWHKGESSGHIQKVQDIRLDCDGDAILLKVKQIGGMACHTGRASCFYLAPQAHKWQAVEPVLKDPEEIYAKPQ